MIGNTAALVAKLQYSGMVPSYHSVEYGIKFDKL